MRIYEELFIVKPDAPEEEVAQFVSGLEELITSSGGTMESTEKWGKRKLAYEVRGYAEGVYTLLVFLAPNSLVRELERRLRVADMVIKYLTVRVDEDRKRLEKKKKQRERRAARKPSTVAAPAAPAPAAPAPAAPAPEAPGKPTEESVETSSAE